MMDSKVLEYSDQIKKLGIENTILEHPTSKNIDEVVSSLALTRSDSAATLIMKADDEFVAIIRCDDCKLDNKKVKKNLGIENLRIATAEEFTKLTGLQPGAAIYFNPSIKKTLIDKKVLEKEYIVGGSGSFSYSIKHKTKDLIKIPGSQIVNVAEKALIMTETKYSGKKRVLSGIRATGRLHLGNYLGAVKGMLELQNNPEYETLYMVADVHTITTPFTIEELRKNRREVIIDYLAAGLDPEKSVIFQQSEVAQHIELAFYFSSVATIARMQHLPTFKEKVKLHPGHSTMALLNYPILMASDILIYKASLVPVGIDQEPHLEVAREIARKMNQFYGTDFPEPKRFATKGEYIPSLKGEGKMGKSVEGSYINLTDSLDEIQKKIRSVPTATKAGGEMTPGVKTLFTFANLYLSSEVEKYKKEFNNGTLQFVTVKDEISEAIYKELQPFQERRKKIEADQSYLNKVIKEGAEKARAIASQTVKEVREKMGLL
ncbi:tryptophan--tRNA ligase [Candidatus Roizmanbacteria bacterium]|nr:tryptophan--tRNA ligase [Candidatus Roizmanbacteria bacterium]